VPPRQVEASTLQLVFEMKSHAGEVYVTSPVLQDPPGLVDTIADELEKDTLRLGVLVRKTLGCLNMSSASSPEI
jgi:hypothetical protein